MENDIEFEHIKRWGRPDHYMGKEYFDYYVIYAKSRDSGNLTDSNFDHILNKLGGESKTVIVERASHWLCGYIDFIFVHEDDMENLNKANEMVKFMKINLMLDEDDYDRRVDEEVQELLDEIEQYPDTYPGLPEDHDDWYEYARNIVMERDYV